MKVAGIQLDIVWEDPKSNFERSLPLLAQAKAHNAVLAILPEMFATGFTMDSSKAVSAMEDTIGFLSKAAQDLGLWILAGFVAPGEPKPKNICALFDPKGNERLRYHKIHPFSLASEDQHYSAGHELHTFTLNDLRITPLICYDLRFPEPFRIAAQNTDLFVVIANWPDKRISAWSDLLKARAIENQCFVLGVNRCGQGNGLTYQGDSAFYDPMGDSLAHIRGREGVIYGDVTAQKVGSVRSSLSFLKDRKPDAYRKIEDAFKGL